MDHGPKRSDIIIIQSGSHIALQEQYYFNLILQIPLFVLAAYRYFYPLKNFTSYGDKNPFSRTNTTTIQHILTKYTAYYYISDICITLYENRVFDGCHWPFFFHHVLSFPLLILINDRNYLPLIFLIFAAVHALLLAFPY